MQRALLIAGLVLVLVGAAGCTSDCEAHCEKMKECLGGEVLTDTCVEDCQTNIDAEGTSTDAQLCVDCTTSHECTEIFPEDPEVASVCEDACGYGGES
jgi:hypothetical protein